MAATWGDPSTDSFRKKHVREARAAGGVALVNAQILSVTSRLLEGLSDAHVDIPEEIPSFDEGGTDAQRLGLAVHLALPVPPPAEIGDLVEKWGFDGFQVEESDLIELRFIGTPDDALRLNDEALALHLNLLESEDVSGPSPIRWPGLRDLVDGDTGQDVRFLRLLLNAGDAEAPVGEDLFDKVRRFQERRGARQTGLIDVDLWRRVIPSHRPLVAQGDSGFVVRVVQAALATYEGATSRVSGTWGVLTSRDIRALQKEYSLRVGSFVRAPEWAILLGPEIPRIEEARRAAKGVGVPISPDPVDETGGSVHTDPDSVHTTAPHVPMNPIAGLPSVLVPVLTEEQAKSIREDPMQHEHKPVQHRDGKEPWCKVCKLTADGSEPKTRMQRASTTPKAPPKKRSTPRSAPKKV